MKNRKTKNAFTLIEILTVIAIIGVLAAILIPVVGKARSAAHAASCLSNMRQLATSLLIWSESNRGKLPDTANPGWDEAALSILSDATPTPWNPMLRCAADKTERTTSNPEEPRSYSINPVLFNQLGQYDHAGWNPANPGTRKGGEGMLIRNIGNPARMVMLSEKHDTVNSYKAAGWFGSASLTDSHNGGMNAAFCDGHARRIRRTADLLVMDGNYSVYQTTCIRNN
ncbi:MAG: prepilin-type N-terminal cleavage/methylation domain-containing protein [Opitutaceae bacterium]|jgi:prepilin-type N-terminal cleavage/methylation domain-containing protein/prepilin-type processing-associated H-X9-DG protein|nr:prepilin-type N-terminal cleavage/methylation domain-containing protein [Opitutaceae bacterium]